MANNVMPISSYLSSPQQSCEDCGTNHLLVQKDKKGNAVSYKAVKSEDLVIQEMDDPIKIKISKKEYAVWGLVICGIATFIAIDIWFAFLLVVLPFAEFFLSPALRRYRHAVAYQKEQKAQTQRIAVLELESGFARRLDVVRAKIIDPAYCEELLASPVFCLYEIKNGEYVAASDEVLWGLWDQARETIIQDIKTTERLALNQAENKAALERKEKRSKLLTAIMQRKEVFGGSAYLTGQLFKKPELVDLATKMELALTERLTKKDIIALIWKDYDAWVAKQRKEKYPDMPEYKAYRNANKQWYLKNMGFSQVRAVKGDQGIMGHD
jgi:hypothetical protein